MKFEELNALAESKLDQEWAHATDWIAKCFEMAPTSTQLMFHILGDRNVTAIRALDDRTLAQVCNMAHLCLAEMTKRLHKRMEDQP